MTDHYLCGSRSERINLSLPPTNHLHCCPQMERQASRFVHQYGSAAASSGRKSHSANNHRHTQSGGSKKKPNLLVRRTLRVKIKKSKPILGIAIEGGFNVSGQLLPRVVCVHVSSHPIIFLSSDERKEDERAAAPTKRFTLLYS